MEVTQEHSAGGIIIRKRDNEVYVLLIKDMNGNWTFPKGVIDPGEDARSAAKREIQEETGLKKVEMVAPLPPIEYWYVRDNQKIHKDVTYFIFEVNTEEDLLPQTDEGITEARWVLFSEAERIIGYLKTNLELLQQTKAIIG